MPINSPVELVEPSLGRLPRYIAALEAGWSPDTTELKAALPGAGSRDASGEQLEAIRNDAESFVRELIGRESGTITLAWTAPRCRACRAASSGFGTVISAVLSIFALFQVQKRYRRTYPDMLATQSCRGGGTAATPGEHSGCCCRLHVGSASSACSSVATRMMCRHAASSRAAVVSRLENRLIRNTPRSASSYSG